MIFSDSVGSLLGHFSYAGVALTVALAGYVIPLPEEVVLLLIGYLAASGLNNVWVAVIVVYAALLASDYLAYTLIRAGTTLIHFLGGRFSEQRLAVFEKRMQEHSGKTIFILRFAVGLRFLSVLLAGSLRVPPRTFLLYDGLALLIYTPLYIFLGYHFHARISGLLMGISLTQHVISIVGLVVVGLALIFGFRYVFWRRTEKKSSAITPEN